MCCLYSLSEVMPYVMKDQITQHIIPIFIKATKDDIPNVKFCVSKIIAKTRQYIDTTVFANSLVPPLKDMAIDSDKDVAHFA